MITLLVVPYHLGHRGVGMGAGPFELLDAGLERVVAAYDDVEIEWVESTEPFRQEIAADFDVNRSLAEHVASVRRRGATPFVVGGNCSAAVATTAGEGDVQRRGVVWFDAHADAHTPETSSSGFLEGMPVAVLTGRAWQEIARSIDRFAPISDTNMVLAGVRSMEPAERRLVGESRMEVVPPDELPTQLPQRLEQLGERVDDVHLHVDLDVIDLADGRANEYAAKGGPTIPQLCDGIVAVSQHCRIDSVSLTSYNPMVDGDRRACESGLRLADALARAIGHPR